MEPVQESIFSSAIRSLCKAFSAVIGIGLATLPLLLFVGSFRSDYEGASKVDMKFLPDLEGNAKIVSPTSPVILRVNIHGVIGGKNGVTAEEINTLLFESRKGLFSGDRVKGILLHVNTPGGTVTDSDNIYQYLMKYKEKHNVPVFAYVDGLCASGGMFIGCAADEIHASRASVVGSVGVIMGPFLNYTGALDKIGVQAKTLTHGTGKDELSSFRPWKENEGDTFDIIGDHMYNLFVDLVTKHRPKVNKEQLLQEYGAKIFDAATAEKIGYIDNGSSSYSATLEKLLTAANIDKTSTYQVVEIAIKKPWLQDLFAEGSCLLKDAVKTSFFPKAEHPFSYSYEQSSSSSR